MILNTLNLNVLVDLEIQHLLMFKLSPLKWKELRILSGQLADPLHPDLPMPVKSKTPETKIDDYILCSKNKKTIDNFKLFVLFTV